MAANVYNIGSEVYLRESAAKGFLESYVVVKLGQGPDGIWKYTVGTPQKPPINSTTVSDRNTLKGNFGAFNIEFMEDELVPFCTALDMAIAVALANYNRLISLKAARCPESGSGSA